MLRGGDETHERAGQLALGVTLIEGILAIGVLTLLNTYVTLGSQVGRPTLWHHARTIGSLCCPGWNCRLLIVPWLLRRVGIAAGEELQTLGVAALLLALAAMTYAAGYSLALGSLLLGVIVSETPSVFKSSERSRG